MPDNTTQCRLIHLSRFSKAERHRDKERNVDRHRTVCLQLNIGERVLAVPHVQHAVTRKAEGSKKCRRANESNSRTWTAISQKRGNTAHHSQAHHSTHRKHTAQHTTQAHTTAHTASTRHSTQRKHTAQRTTQVHHSTQRKHTTTHHASTPQHNDPPTN